MFEIFKFKYMYVYHVSMLGLKKDISVWFPSIIGPLSEICETYMHALGPLLLECIDHHFIIVVANFRRKSTLSIDEFLTHVLLAPYGQSKIYYNALTKIT